MVVQRRDKKNGLLMLFVLAWAIIATGLLLYVAIRMSKPAAPAPVAAVPAPAVAVKVAEPPPAPKQAAISRKLDFQKGMCYVTWNANRFGSAGSDASLRQMKDNGVTWVAILVTWFQARCGTTDIYPTENTPSDASVVHAIETAHALGMKVMLKPHLDIIDTSDGSWRGDIYCVAETEWERWFRSYQKFITHYAKMAQDNGAELFCVGTELRNSTSMKPDLWREMVIKPCREAYSGPLTYAANWDEEYIRIKFWDMLDYAGVDVYFPISDEQRPTLEQLRKGWEPWLKDMVDWQASINKPVIFPEVGYCSVEYAAKRPWEETGGKVDLELQADCYQVVYETFWDKEWFYGMYWWKWGTDVRIGGSNNRGYYMQNKPAQAIVAQWYKNVPVPKKAQFPK